MVMNFGVSVHIVAP
jgi:hypothetical protein